MLITLNQTNEPIAPTDCQTMLTFLAMFAHEVKTQITGMIQVCQYIQSEKNKDFYLKAMSATSNNALHIVDNLLTTVKIQAGKLTVHVENETFLFNTWIKPIVQSIETAALVQQKDICLTIHPNLNTAYIITDKIKLGQILYNLLNNALKFSYAKTCIAVKCYSFKTGLIIQVINQGISIPPDKINTLFKPFHQLDSGLAGTGLGLYLSKIYVETLGGILTVQSEEKASTVFTINIPDCIHHTTESH